MRTADRLPSRITVSDQQDGTSAASPSDPAHVCNAADALQLSAQKVLDLHTMSLPTERLYSQMD
ncbi:MAG TPA: hypothetical protein VGE93_23585 [Bryobacteraceae bacterium]